MLLIYALAIFILFIAAGCSSVKSQSSATNKDQEKKETTNYQSNNEEDFWVIAHRGASGYAPEDTMASYKLAKKMDADYIEIDIHMTKDGRLVAIHDAKVNRTTNGQGKVANMTLEEIKKLDAGSWFNKKYPQKAEEKYKGIEIPTLQEIFKYFGKSVNYYIETKSPQEYPGMTDKLLNVLEAYNLVDKNPKTKHVVVQSFSPKSLQKIHKKNPNIPLIQLLWYTPNKQGKLVEWKGVTPTPKHIGEKVWASINQYAIGIGSNIFYDGQAVIQQSFVQEARDHGLLVHAYTINKKKRMKQLISWGVTGMFSNYPDKLSNVLQHMKP